MKMHKNLSPTVRNDRTELALTRTSITLLDPSPPRSQLLELPVRPRSRILLRLWHAETLLHSRPGPDFRQVVDSFEAAGQTLKQLKQVHASISA
jgi:hypothetical protein